MLVISTLISQPGGDDVFKADMQSQKVMQFIEWGVKKVYMLLTGL